MQSRGGESDVQVEVRVEVVEQVEKPVSLTHVWSDDG